MAIQALVFVVLISSYFQCGQSEKFKFHVGDMYDAYKEINEHLCDNVKSDNVDENMAEASRWLDKLQSGHSNNRDLIGALERFVSMIKTDGPIKCSKESAEILHNNDIITLYASRDVESKYAAPTRVELMVNHYCMKHAKECKDVYTKILDERYEKLDKNVIDIVSTLTDEIDQIINNEGTKEEQAEVGYNTIKEFSRDDPDSKFLEPIVDRRRGERILNKDKVKELYHKYLITPCEKFVNTINYDGFLKASDHDREWVYQNYPFASRFYSIRHRIKICGKLIGPEREEFLKSVTKEANKVHD